MPKFRRGLGLPLVALAAMVARGIVAASFASHPLLQPDAGLDTGVYVDLARRIAGGDLLLRALPAPFFVSPLYAYVVGAALAVTGSTGALLAVQSLLGAAAVWLTGDTAGRVFDERASVPAALLLAGSGVVAFHESILLQAALDPFLAALTLWLLVRSLKEEPGRATRFLAAGLSLGVFALNRPNVLPFAVVVTLLLVLSRGARTGGCPAALFCLGTALGVAPATIRNFAVSGEPVLISSHGGLNLLVGNGPGAEGVYRALDGITPSIAGQAADARRVAEAAEGRSLSSREVSAYFALRAWSWVSAHPGDAARLFARKLRLVLSGEEAPLNFSTPWYRDRSATLRALVVGPGLLVPLGAVGLVLALLGAGKLRPPDAMIWVSFVPVYAGLVAAFFVATRYRLPLYPALAAASGGAVVLVADAVRTRRSKNLVFAAIVGLPLAALSLWPTGLYDGAADEEMHWVLYLAGTGSEADAAQARRLAREAAPAHPYPALFWKRTAAAWGSAGKADDEISSLTRSLEVESDPKIEALLAARLERRGLTRAIAGDAAGALPDLEEAVRLDSRSAAAALNLAAVLAERGDRTRARALAREALALEPGYGKAEALLRALGPGK